MIPLRKASPACLAVAKQRIQKLRQLPPAEIVALPNCSTELVDGIAVTIYRDDLPSSDVRVVVQAMLPWLFVFSWVGVDGFLLSRNGERSDVSEEMLWEF